MILDLKGIKKWLPHDKLILIAAELVRGAGFDERFELDNRLPRWVLASVAHVAERQRQLGCDIRDSADAMRIRIAALERVAEAAINHLRDPTSVAVFAALRAAGYEVGDGSAPNSPPRAPPTPS